MPTAPWPRLDRFKEHTIELPVAELDVAAQDRRRAACRRSTRALELGKGVVHVLRQPNVATGSRCSPPSAPARLRTQLPRARPAPVLLQLQARLVRELLRHRRCEHAGFDDEQSGEEPWWNEWSSEERRDACRDVPRAAPEPVALHVRFRDRSIAELARAPVGASSEFFARLQAAAPREQQIARDLLAEIRGAAAVPRARRPRLPDARPRRADALGRRGAAHPPGRAARLEPAGRVLRAGRADHRPAPARQRRSCSTRSTELARQGQHAGGGGARRGHHPPRRPHASISVPAPACAAASWWPRARCASSRANPALGDRPLPARAAAASGAAAPPGKRRDAAPDARSASRCTTSREVDVADPAGAAGGGHGRLGLGQVDAGARCAATPTCKRLVSTSGAGVRGVRTVRGRRGRAAAGLAGCAAVHGVEHLDRVLEVDQTPIGKTPRSCPATYIGFWDEIRKLSPAPPRRASRGYAREPLLLQHRRGPLRGLRRPGRADHRDELPARREGAVRRVRRQALQLRDAERHLARQAASATCSPMDVDEAVEFFAAHAARASCRCSC